MNTPRFAELGRLAGGPELSARSSARADEQTPEDAPADQPGKKKPAEKKDDDMSEIDANSSDYKAGQKAAEEATRKAERDRFAAVTASEHYAGREALAGKLLKSDMSAVDITEALAAAPKAAQAAEEPKRSAEEEELAQGREMLDGMKQQGNKDLGNKSDDGSDKTRANASNVWKRAREANAKK